MTARDAPTVGVDVGATNVRAALVAPDGRILAAERQALGDERPPERVAAVVSECVDRVRSKSDVPPAGLGVGVAGQVDADNGVVRFAPNLGWRDVPFGEKLRARTGLPVVLANDVRAATLGEWNHGAGRGAEDLVCVYVGTGIGGGVVSGGRLLQGVSGLAGELGHVPVAVGGAACSCGGRGCVEAYAGGWAIARRAMQMAAADSRAGKLLLDLAGGDPAAVTSALVARADHDGDPLARRVVDDAAEALSAACVGLVNAFNPQILIVGGGVVVGLPRLVGAVARAVEERALPASRESVRVVPAELGDDAGAVGAAVLARKFR